MKRIAINGFGRIGRIAFRMLIGSDDYEVVAINSHGTPEDTAYLLKYDTVHRTLDIDDIEVEEDGITVDGKFTKVLQIDDPKDYPWKEMDIDLVLDCTGKFTKDSDAIKHIEAGAKHVLISAPGKGNMKTVVYGVNEKVLEANDRIISAASCTTNCLAPVLNLIEKYIGITSGFMTTVHAYTNDQNTLDGSHKNGIASRRGRSSSMAFSQMMTSLLSSAVTSYPLSYRTRGSSNSTRNSKRMRLLPTKRCRYSRPLRSSLPIRTVTSIRLTASRRRPVISSIPCRSTT